MQPHPIPKNVLLGVFLGRKSGGDCGLDDFWLDCWLNRRLACWLICCGFVLELRGPGCFIMSLLVSSSVSMDSNSDP